MSIRLFPPWSLISEQIVKILTFYKFRLACHNQTKLSLSLLSQASSVKLQNIFRPQQKDFSLLHISKQSGLTYICDWSLPGEILLEGVALGGVVVVGGVGAWQGAVHTPRGADRGPEQNTILWWEVHCSKAILDRTPLRGFTIFNIVSGTIIIYTIQAVQEKS